MFRNCSSVPAFFKTPNAENSKHQRNKFQSGDNSPPPKIFSPARVQSKALVGMPISY